jgi:hypothetical protein
MKIYELINFNRELLKKLSDAHINTSDYKNIDVYLEYKRLRNDGLKKTYIVSYLSDQYNMSERQVYAVIAKMERVI